MSKNFLLSNFLKNYLSTISFILAGYFFYISNSYYSKFLYSNLNFSFANFSLETTSIFKYIIFCYILFLIPYYLYYQTKSKARIVYSFLYNFVTDFFNYKMSEIERVSILAWIVKLFFAPLMIFWLSGHILNLVNNMIFSWNDKVMFFDNFSVFFDKHFFWLCFTAILFFDVLFFTIGYLFEAPFLKNQIKSVEPTILGWFVALICYPPFNGYLTNIIGWYSTDFPKFENEFLHLFMNFSIIILMGIYSWASISLNFKASNLTNRGIISKGPYRFVRHPAYICKNLAWWIGGIPMLIITSNSGNWKYFGLVIISLLGWSFIYFLRAITEERHLLRDPDYVIYKKKVKYKFIPYIW